MTRLKPGDYAVADGKLFGEVLVSGDALTIIKDDNGAQWNVPTYAHKLVKVRPSERAKAHARRQVRRAFDSHMSTEMLKAVPELREVR